MKTTAAVVYEPGKPIEIEELDLDELTARDWGRQDVAADNAAGRDAGPRPPRQI